MLRAIDRTKALLLAACLVLCCWAALDGYSGEARSGIGRPAPYGDLQLYRDVAENVSAGDGYYSAATTLHRQHGYPTAPFVTVRLPTLALAAASFGWPILHLLLLALLAASAFAWYSKLGGGTTKAEQVGAGAMVVCGGVLVSQSWAVLHHDLWAGVLLTLAIPLREGRTWPIAIVCAAMAVAVRELAFPFVMLSLVLATVERRFLEASAWTVLTVAFSAGMIWHAHQVHAYSLTTDLHSPGWNGMLGLGGLISAVVEVSPFKLLPAPMAAPLVLVALFGWIGLPNTRIALISLFWLGGFAAAIALFARENNVYWAMELMPAWLIGLVFVPRAISRILPVAKHASEPTG